MNSALTETFSWRGLLESKDFTGDLTVSGFSK